MKPHLAGQQAIIIVAPHGRAADPRGATSALRAAASAPRLL